MFRGNVVYLYTARDAAAPMESTQEVKAVAGRGLEGDRYFDGKGHWSKTPGVSRQVTLIEIETIEALERDQNIAVAPGAARRNVVTRGVPLNHLVGREFTIGGVRIRGIRLCEPCDHLQRTTGKQLIKGLRHRGGLRAQILTQGTIRVGDTINPTA